MQKRIEWNRIYFYPGFRNTLINFRRSKHNKVAFFCELREKAKQNQNKHKQSSSIELYLKKLWKSMG